MKYLLLTFFIFSSLFSEELISPIEINITYDVQKAKLGKRLFHETKLSKNNTISCASCHIIADGGDDNKQFSTGINSLKGDMNAPTVLNSKYNISQFWDGRAKDLTEQAKGPIHNPVEMGTDFKDVVRKLKKEISYVTEFSKIYKDGITTQNILDAIVEFENALVTPNSRFDLYLKGDLEALSKDEKDGYKLFKEFGCISCHNGVNIGGNLYQKMGIVKNYETKSKNLGRYNVTKDEEDRYFFKVPTLRNIELTAPYFHDGEQVSLEDAVKAMTEYQVGLEPTQEEIDSIISFLKTLTGEEPKIMEEN